MVGVGIESVVNDSGTLKYDVVLPDDSSGSNQWQVPVITTTLCQYTIDILNIHILDVID